MRAYSLLLLIALAAPGTADGQAVPSGQFPAPPPPQTPTAAEAKPQTITLQMVPTAAEAKPPRTITLNVQAPPPPPQTITLVMVPTAAPIAVAQAPAVAAQVHYPGPIRLAVGALGERLARQKMARIFFPVQQADVQVVPAAARVQLAPAALVQVQAQAAEMLPVLATPQAPSKHRLFNFGR